MGWSCQALSYIIKLILTCSSVYYVLWPAWVEAQIYSGMKLYMFWTVPLSTIRSLFTVHSAIVYVIQVCRQLSSRTRIGTCYTGPAWQLSTNLYDIYHCWVYSWWWTEKLSETCRVPCHNKFVKSVHLVGFLIQKSTGNVDGWSVFFNLCWYHAHHLQHQMDIHAVKIS